MLGQEASIDVDIHAGSSITFIVIFVFVSLMCPLLALALRVTLAVGIVFWSARCPAVAETRTDLLPPPSGDFPTVLATLGSRLGVGTMGHRSLNSLCWRPADPLPPPTIHHQCFAASQPPEFRG